MTSEAGARPERRWGDKTVGERRAERRDRLMRVAINLYGREGFRNVSVKSICAAAGLSERYLYESFGNGEDLLRQCFTKVNNELVAQLREAGEQSPGPIPRRLRAAVLVYLNHLREDPAGARLFLIEMANVSPATEALFSASLDEFGSLLVEVLRSDPGFKGSVPPLLLRGVIGGGLHIARAWISRGCAEPIEEVADAYLLLYLPLLAQQPESDK